MNKTVVAPRPPSDGQEWECQCARCGSSCDWESCCECDDGYEFDYDNEYPAEHTKCHDCNGYGGWWTCLSSSEFCNGNPVEGREQVKRGQIEWFTIKERT